MPRPHRRWQSDLPLAAQRPGGRAAAARAGTSAGNSLPRGRGRQRQTADIDGYDDDYLHLILWDEEDLEIVGAYRFMPTTIQLAKRGLEGIYSYSLFHYDGRMDDVLQHGIELGRSLSSRATGGVAGWTTLWSGIGAYLARYPHYRYLFGPVSILRIAARRPRSAGGILPAVVPGDASAGGVASPLSGVAARRAGAVWRGGLQRRPGPA